MTTEPAPPLLEVDRLSIRFPGREKGQSISAVDSLSYSLYAGKTLAILGESGSGKTVGCRALMGLLSKKAEITGSVRFMGKELLGLSQKEMRQYRGVDISMVFQDPARALNPTMRIGDQIAEVLLSHKRVSYDVAKAYAIELLTDLSLSSPERQYYSYPHQLSGGMQQRVMLAIAVACKPKLLIADEATRALDLITQTQIIKVLKDLQCRLNMALIFVSHDLKLAERIADDVLVMESGNVVEYASAEKIFTAPEASYTKALVRASRSRHFPRHEHSLHEKPLLVANDLVHTFTSKPFFGASADQAHALAGVSLKVRSGETLGIVGETGSGKSTLARVLLQMPKPASGTVHFLGEELTSLKGRALQQKRRYIQMVFQDCFTSMNPKWSTFSIVEEPLRGLGLYDRRESRRMVAQALESVDLPASVYGWRRPAELSGGQCQRVAIARALVTGPKMVIFDESLSSLDVLIQQQQLDLLHTLREELKLSYLFISHDIAQIQMFCHRVAVMHAGQLCEIVPQDKLINCSLHPYTKMLIASIKGHEQGSMAELEHSVMAKGEPPWPTIPAAACRFKSRCPRAKAICSEKVPMMRTVNKDHEVACHFYHIE